VDPAWWSAFGDPVLTRLVAMALAANPDIALGAERVAEARAQERLARAQLRLDLEAGAGVFRERTVDAFGHPFSDTAATPLMQASWDLDLFHRLSEADAAARAQILSAQGARDAMALAIASSTASGYITLRALDARLATARATLVARTEGLRIARRRAETGYTSNLELRQAEAEYQATAQLVPQAQLAVSRQEDALSALVGAPPGAIPRGLSLEELAAPPVPDGLPSDLLRRRPDLYEAEQALVAADHSLDSARAAFMPQLQLTGSAGLALSTALASPVTIWTIGGSILAPIFNGGRLAAQADIAASRRDQAAFVYRRAALAAFRDVEDSLAGVQRSGEQATALIGQRDALAGALSNATKRYRAGYSSYLDQLDAQRGLLTAELALIQARADRLTAYSTLYQSMGGGWTTPAAAATSR
jgi:NodT family efflux transporter outer membrane factor (OMF) lipoprotein